MPPAARCPHFHRQRDRSTGLSWPQPGAPGRVQGLSLIEAMVAAAILALGIIGMARMQAQMVRGSTDAQLRYAAVQLADEHLSMVRVDSSNAACYTLPAAGTCNSAAASTHTSGWSARVAASLPGASAPSVTLDAVSGRLVVNIGWTSRQGADPRLLSVATDVRR